MSRLKYIIILLVLLSIYIVSVIYLDDVKILAGNITPIVNMSALWGLVAVGLATSVLLLRTTTHTFSFLPTNKGEANRRNIYLLLAVLALFRIAAFFLSPHFIQYMHVWPDSNVYLGEMQSVIQDPIYHFFDRKSPVYTTWLALNHLTFGEIMGSQGSYVYFGATVFLNDIVPPIILQNIIGVFSALICFHIFSRINIRLAYAVTLLAFINPVTLALENAILRESLALFFILSGFAVFLKAIEQRKNIYGFLSGALFVLAYLTRPELIIIYILLCLLFFIYSLFQKQGMWKAAILFCLPLVLSMLVASYSMSRKYAEHRYGGRFFTAMYGLKSKCWFYESKTFPELIRNIQKKAMKCEEERYAPCDAPLTTTSLIRIGILEEIEKYTQTKGLQNSKEEVLDQIFIDVVKNNPSCYIQSVLTNMAYILIHNVENTTPILYDGDNYWISQNWNYYVSPKMLVLYEGNNTYYKYIVWFFRTIELYTTQKVLFPFFFIGSIIILITIRKGLFTNGSNTNLLMTCMLLFSWAHLLFLSLMAGPVARFAYLVFPFIFAIEIIGVMGSYNWLKSRFLNQREMETGRVLKVLKSSGKLKGQLLLSLLVIMIIGIPIYDRYMANKFGRGYDEGTQPKWNDLVIIKRFLRGARLVEKEWLAEKAKNAAPESPLSQYSFPLANSSLESWHELNNIPERWSYAQTGSGGGVFKESKAKNVKFGSFSAKVTRSNTGASQLYYTLSDEDAKRLRGKTILFGGWVKSQNTVSDKVCLFIPNLSYDLDVTKSCYQNTGEWEFIYFWYQIPLNAKLFNLYFSVDSNANADAYFDGAILAAQEVLSINMKDRTADLRVKHNATSSDETIISLKGASTAHAVWNMNYDAKDEVTDSKGGHNAASFDAGITEGHSGKARYFNGKSSYIKTPLDFQSWKAIAISFWVKPEQKEGNDLSVILDNGHNAKSNFAIQSVDFSSENWVWHCNGIDINFKLPLNKWTHIVVVASGEKGIIQAYMNGLKIDEKRTDRFEFGSSPLTIGKLANADGRYFKGSIDEVIVWDMGTHRKN